MPREASLAPSQERTNVALYLIQSPCCFRHPTWAFCAETRLFYSIVARRGMQAGKWRHVAELDRSYDLLLVGHDSIVTLANKLYFTLSCQTH